MSTEKVDDEAVTGEETFLSQAEPMERNVNMTNYGSMSSDPSSSEANGDVASQLGASGGAAEPTKKERRSSIRRRSSIKGDDNDVVEFGPGLDTIIKDESYYGYDYDYVIVFPFDEKDEKPETKDKREETIRKFIRAGFFVSLFYSLDKANIFCKLKVNLIRIAHEAERIELVLLLDEEELKARAREGVLKKKQPTDPNAPRDYKVLPIDIPENCDLTQMRPYESIFSRFSSMKRNWFIFKSDRNLKHPFSSMHRIKLIESILEDRHGTGCAFHLGRMVNDKEITDFFPIIDHEEVQFLDKVWLRGSGLPWDQPLEEIRHYLGEKLGFYFSFIGHLTTCLMPLAVIGIAVFIALAVLYGSTITTKIPSLNSSFTYIGAAYSVVVIFWALITIGIWDRQVYRHQLAWGMSDFSHRQIERADYEGEVIISFVTGKKELYFNPHVRAIRVTVVRFLMAIAMLIVVAIVGVVTYIGFSYGSSFLASILNAIVVVVMTQVYLFIAKNLTVFENHRTENEHENSLAIKFFLVQFVNSFAALYYIGFVENYYGNGICNGQPCLYVLFNYVFILMIFKPAVVFSMKIIIPWALSFFNEEEFEVRLMLNSHSRGLDDIEITEIEREYHTPAFDCHFGLIEEYSDCAIQFGIATIFAFACPISPLFILMTCYTRLRCDGYKLIHLVRRPIPYSADNIGFWYNIFKGLIYVAVLTNTALVCFGLNAHQNFGNVGLVWIFISVIILLAIIIEFFNYAFDSFPIDVDIQFQRQKFLVEKLIFTVSDDLHADDGHGSEEAINAPIVITDTDKTCPSSSSYPRNTHITPLTPSKSEISCCV